jgi:hypothetical protein
LALEDGNFIGTQTPPRTPIPLLGRHVARAPPTLLELSTQLSHLPVGIPGGDVSAL